MHIWQQPSSRMCFNLPVDIAGLTVVPGVSDSPRCASRGPRCVMTCTTARSTTTSGCVPPRALMAASVPGTRSCALWSSRYSAWFCVPCVVWCTEHVFLCRAMFHEYTTWICAPCWLSGTAHALLHSGIILRIVLCALLNYMYSTWFCVPCWVPGTVHACTVWCDLLHFRYKYSTCFCVPCWISDKLTV